MSPLKRPRCNSHLLMFSGAFLGAGLGPVLAAWFRNKPLFPHLAALAAIFVVWLIVTTCWLLLARYRASKYKPPWCCQRCGYDLRGTSRASLCPECGGARG